MLQLLGFLFLLSVPQYLATDVEADCYYFVRIDDYRLVKGQLRRDVYYTLVLPSHSCPDAAAIRRKVKKVYFEKTRNANLQPNQIVVFGPYHKEEDADDAYLQELGRTPEGVERQLLTLTLD